VQAAWATIQLAARNANPVLAMQDSVILALTICKDPLMFSNNVLNAVHNFASSLATSNGLGRAAFGVELALAAGGLAGVARAEAAEGTETFYRTMSQANYDALTATGKLPATSETFISPSLEYASKYNGVTVQFNVQAGTTDSLLGMGVRNAGLNGGAYNGLPLVQSGWGSSSAFFKLEGNVVNVGLGRGSALNTFNNNIVNFNLVPKP